MITLTTSAVAAVKAALSRAGDAAGVRVVAAAAVPPGVHFLLHLESGARDGDAIIEQGGLKVFIDPPSQAMTEHIHIDFAAAAGFVFESRGAPAGAGRRN